MNRRTYLGLQLLSIESLRSAIQPGHALAQGTAKPKGKALPVKGELFQVSGREAFLIQPPNSSSSKAKPWVWYAPTLQPYPGPEERWMINQFLDSGISIAGIDVGESYGSPNGTKLFNRLYQELTQNRGFNTRPALLARSRGGLMLYNWASQNPEKVSAIAGIYPVCDMSSWPGLEKAAPAYEMSADDLRKNLSRFNPVDGLAPLAKAKVPIFHIHGDSDTVVPLEQNSGALVARYEKLGGPAILEIPKGQGHNMWKGFFESQNLVNFILKNIARENTPAGSK